MNGNPPCGCVVSGDGSELWWPKALPNANLDYEFNIDCEVAASGDSVASVALSIAPSGEGEREALDLSVTGELIVAQLTSGQPGRVYRIQIVVTGASGRVWSSVIYQIVSGAASLPPPPGPPPVPGFGTPITWVSGVTVYGPAIAAVADGLVATGTNQATAFPLTAAVSIFASVPPGTGAQLNGGIVSGTMVVQNNDPTNALAIYPPDGAAIGELGVDAPFLVNPNGGRINFSTQAPTTKWEGG